MAAVKGSTVRTRRQFVLHELGDAGWQRVLGRLSEDDRSHWSLSVLASSWYPAAAVAALEDAIVQEMGGQPAEVCTELGAFSAEQNLPSTYQSFFAMGQSPVAFFQKLISLYPSLYDYGRVWLAKTTRNGTEIQHDFEGHATRTNCLTARSFFERAGSMAGIQDLRVREVCCQASGAAVCVLSAEWEPTPESG